MLSSSISVSRVVGYFLATSFFVLALASALPGRSPQTAQFTRAEVLWQVSPGERVRFATDYVDVRLCRNLATTLAEEPSESERVEVTCHTD